MKASSILKTLIQMFWVVLLSFLLSFWGKYFALQTGILKESIGISGTGSMYPTFPKGQGANQTVARVPMRKYPSGVQVFNFHLFSYQLQKGDIVSFENNRTDSITKSETGTAEGFVKRIIALPGDNLEIRDGFVLINGQVISEPYIASARSTFGGTFLPDCKKLVIPQGQVFVMGDNRKGSSDSRFDIGLVSFADIDHVLPLVDQKPYESNWRDTANDTKAANLPILDTKTYLDLLNAKRQASGLKPLKYQSKLEASAEKRAGIIIKYDDFSYEATRSGYTMEKAMRDVGYSNIVWGEAPTVGYYDAQELIDNFFEFPDSKKFLLQKDFQETGISAEVGLINGCPVQVVVQHFAGYKPPDYSKEMIDGWQKVLDNLNLVFPSWSNTKNQEIISVFQTRIERITSLVKSLKSQTWLTPEQELWLKEDDALSKHLQELTTQINHSQ